MARRAAVLFLALALAVAGFVFVDRAFRGSGPTPGQSPSPTAPMGNGVIAFGCGYHICTVRPDGSGFTDLIEPFDKDLVLAAYSPVVSPDGSQIAFRGYPQGGGSGGSGGANYDIYVMGVDGTGLTNLTGPNDPQGQGYAQWSPDGSMIAYEGDDGTYVMNADGSHQRKLVDGGYPTWSPDGSWIGFVMGRDHGADLWKIHPDGTGLTQLTQSTGWNELPVWSPDGSKIAFLRERAIYVVNDDGTGLSVVADMKRAYPFQPQWSPDGSMLAFEVEMPATSDAEASGERNYDIFTVNADGTGLVDLTPTTDITENYPIWSPDGTKIAFGASRMLSGENAGSFDLYTMNPDGTEIERLTRDAGLGVEFDISWQPVVADESPTTSPLPTPTETPTPSPVSTAQVGQTIDVGQASALMYADGSVWVDVLRDAATNTGTVLRIDPGSGEIQARIAVEAYPDSEHGGSGMVFDGRYLWIVGTRWATDGAAGGILVRIDPDTDTAETIDLPVGVTDIDLVFDDGFLWTTGASSPGKDPRVLQIDPVTGAVVSETPIDAEWLGGLVVEGGAIWVMEMSVRNSTVQGDATFVRLEPGTGAVLARVPAVDENGVMGSTMPVATEGVIWVPTGSELLELDPQTGEALSRFDLAVGGDFEPAPDRSVWCLGGFGWNELERLDPVSGKVDVTVHLDRKPIPTAMTVAPSSVWVLTYDGMLTRVALN
ncbi:MAG: hypothetical protein M3P43_10820 [Actinomycetota bacterium]|nr:hypothetical protein [Actinomycetota bacterium]